jgi:hypothetical protein
VLASTQHLRNICFENRYCTVTVALSTHVRHFEYEFAMVGRAAEIAGADGRPRGRRRPLLRLGQCTVHAEACDGSSTRCWLRWRGAAEIASADGRSDAMAAAASFSSIMWVRTRGAAAVLSRHEIGANIGCIHTRYVYRQRSGYLRFCCCAKNV